MLRMLALLAASALAACAGGAPQTGYGELTAFYDRSLVNYVAKGGAFPLVVHGAPAPGMSAASATAAVARELKLPGWFPRTAFAPAPVATAPSGDYRLVLVFNPATAISAYDVCGDLSKVPVAQPGPETVVRAAFCARGDWVTEAWGRGPAGAPGTLAFRSLMDQVLAAAFPERNWLNEPDGGDRSI